MRCTFDTVGGKRVINTGGSRNPIIQKAESGRLDAGTPYNSWAIDKNGSTVRTLFYDASGSAVAHCDHADKDTVDGHEETLSLHGDRLVGVEGRATTLESTVAFYADRIDELQSDSSLLRTDLGEQTGRITTALGATASLGIRATSLETFQAGASDRLDNIEDDTQYNYQQILQLNSGIMTTNSGLSTQTGRIDGLNTGLTTQTGRIDTLNTGLSTQTGRIDTLNTGLTTQTGRIDTLNTGLTTQTGRIDTLVGYNVMQRGVGGIFPFSNVIILPGGGNVSSQVISLDANSCYLICIQAFAPTLTTANFSITGRLYRIVTPFSLVQQLSTSLSNNLFTIGATGSFITDSATTCTLIISATNSHATSNLVLSRVAVIFFKMATLT